MARLVSSWCADQSLPENYIFPPETRPGKSDFTLCNSVPVVDLSQAVDRHSRSDVILQILKASSELGFFQVINHEVPEKVLKDTMSVLEEFFEMHVDQKASIYAEAFTKGFQIYTSSPNYSREEIHCWRDNMRHACHPLDEYINDWPTTPSRHRDIVATYCVEARKMGLEILDLIAEALRLDPGYFGDKLSAYSSLSANYYPPCPDPSLTLGIPKHCDPNLITILHQGVVSGLQIFSDGEWMTVQPLPTAFVVNIGYTLQIISNNMLKGGEHRVVTNSQAARTSAALFISPIGDCIIEPAETLTKNANTPPLYRAFQYKDFLKDYLSKGGDGTTILETYKRHALAKNTV